MFDAIIRFSLANRLLVLLAAVLFLMGGIYTAIRLPVDVFPDLNAPTVTLLTEAHGMAPEEVESLVTLPIEATVNGATGVRRVRSFSSSGVSIVHVEFDWDMDVYNARQIVAEKLQAVANALPEGVETPQMAPMSSIMGEILLIGLYAEQRNGQPAFSTMDLRTMADWTIRRRLLAVPGVAQVVPIGGEVKEYQIELDPVRMQRYGVSLNEALAAAEAASENASGGVLRKNGKEYQIRGLGRAFRVDHLNASAVKVLDGVPILFSDIATVQVGGAVPFGSASANARDAVVMTVTKQPGANTLELTDRIDEVLTEIRQNLPDGMVLQQDTFRQSDFIEVAVHNVLEALRDGALLVVVVLFLFLGNVRITFISVLAMPLSIAVTFLIFRWMEISINTMTLGGIGIAIGALVDDAIIDIENVYRRLRENFHKPTAERKSVNAVVFEASREIRKPMISATLIITVVFLPLFFLSGVEGRLLQPMGLAYILSIFASLLIALTVTPVLASVLLASERLYRKDKEGWLAGWLKPAYRATLERVLTHRWIALAATLLMLTSALFLGPGLGRSFLPEFNEGALTISYVTSADVSLDESTELGRMAEQALLAVKGVKSVQRRTGRGELSEHSQTVNAGEIDVVLDLERNQQAELIQNVREALASVAGVQFTVGQPISHRIDHMLSGTRASIAVKIFGSELQQLRRLGESIEAEMADIEGIVDLAIEPMVNIPQISIRFDRQRMAQHGLTSGQLAEFVDVAFAGETVGRVMEGQRTFNITLRYQASHRNSIERLRDARVTTPLGATLPLSDFASVEYDAGPNQIGRENAQRKLVVQANVAGRDLGSIIAELQDKIEEQVTFPQGYYVEYGGQFESEQAASRAITLISMVSLLVIILILYHEFRSFRDTLIALVNLPLALIGGIWAVSLTGGVVSIASLVGFITLFGIAARNGILLISHYQHLLKSGMPFEQAIRQGSLERLNPILMTALTAGLALIPLALGEGQPGKEIEAPMAIVILGGLFTSTFLNMFVVPTLYGMFGPKPPSELNPPQVAQS